MHHSSEMIFVVQVTVLSKVIQLFPKFSTTSVKFDTTFEKTGTSYMIFAYLPMGHVMAHW